MTIAARCCVVLLMLQATASGADKVWVDTDAGCTGQPRVDPDDCVAIWLMLTKNVVTDEQWLGISASFGNVSQNTSYATLLELADTLTSVRLEAPLSGAFRRPWPHSAMANPRLVDKLCKHLELSPVTILALGPLTLPAAVVNRCRARASKHLTVLAVAGRRSGHVFHPAEERAPAAFLGHGPIFTDFNVRNDTSAAREIAASNVALVLLPYELSRQFEVTSAMVERLTKTVDGRWLASRLKPWLQYWQNVIGRDGFYPFDLMPVAYLHGPGGFDCRAMKVSFEHDGEIGWFGGPPSLLFTTPAAPAETRTQVCLRITARGHKLLESWFIR